MPGPKFEKFSNGKIRNKTSHLFLADQFLALLPCVKDSPERQKSILATQQLNMNQQSNNTPERTDQYLSCTVVRVIDFNHHQHQSNHHHQHRHYHHQQQQQHQQQHQHHECTPAMDSGEGDGLEDHILQWILNVDC